MKPSSRSRSDRDLMARPRKPLELELSQGCANRAAIGGLGRFLSRWAEEVAKAQTGPAVELAAELAAEFAPYASLSPDERRELVRRALEQLEGAEQRPVGWGDPVTALAGVGPGRAEVLAQMGIGTVGDLLSYYPADYEDRTCLQRLSEARHREPLVAQVTVTGPGRAEWRMRPQRAVVPARDETGECTLVWLNQPYLGRQFAAGEVLLVEGQARKYPSGLCLYVRRAERINPAEDNHEPIVPRYATAEGLSEEMLRGLIRQALRRCPQVGPGLLPEERERERGLLPLAEAPAPAHRPEDPESARRGRERLAYEALFALQAEMARRRARHRRRQAPSQVAVEEGALERWAEVLPFDLTAAQRRVIGEVLADLGAEHAGHRLLHGEVGSGKTAVAGAALFAVARSGRQAALMAPTELLAEQHYRVLAGWLEGQGITVGLLTASVPAGQAPATRAALARGEAQVVVGTHALFQKGVEFADLALVVVDEQHRFGVRQRAELVGKGEAVNLLVMSATPIPRTLALTAYGEFEVSVLDELPPGREPVFTQVLDKRRRRRAYETVTQRALQGQRAFVVCPVIEEGRQEFLVAAEQLYEELRQEVPGLRWGLVHGRMGAEQREQTMDQFRRGELEVLVATSVVEVGVDVPEASLMIVENAERFGLAQLHQLRGRVARARREATCFLITGSRNPEVVGRLQVLERTSDGFEIAQEDLLRRGPGELLGERQSGHVDLRLIEAAGDTRRLAQAREDACGILEADPELNRPEHQPLRAYLERRASGEGGWTL